MSVPSKMDVDRLHHLNMAVNTPMNAQLDERIVNAMTVKVVASTGAELYGESSPTDAVRRLASSGVVGIDVHLLVKEKDFKYGPGKEYIAFADGGKNQFGKEMKYVKFYYLYSSNNKVRPGEKTYTFAIPKARTFWGEKANEGYEKVVEQDAIIVVPYASPTDVEKVMDEIAENPALTA